MLQTAVAYPHRWRARRFLVFVVAVAVALAVLAPTPRLEAQGFPARLPLSQLDPTQGMVLRGVAALDEAGKSVSRAGDWNHDGIADALIGAPVATRKGVRWVGESYVLFGSATLPETPLHLSALDGTNGVTLLGVHVVGFTGMSVSDVGDVNRDGIDDVLVGAGIASPNFIPEIGESYVVFGTDAPLSSHIDLAQLDGSDGFNILGLEPPERMGTSVSGAGDFNGDGVLDYVMGANGASPEDRDFAGVSYLVFGATGAQQPDLAQLDGTNGVIVQGLFSGDFLGNGVSNAGDFNGDGLDDLVLGAPRSKRDGVDRVGEAYLVYGSRTTGATLPVLSLDGDNGFAFMGSTGAEEMGFIVSAAGDVNHDGFDDVLVAAPFANRPNRGQSGEVVLLFGNDQSWPAVMSSSGLTEQQGRVIAGIDINGQLGYGVGAAGDVNGDGIDDFVLGAPLASPGGRHQAGVTYVVFGVEAGFPSSIDLAALDGSNGFVLEGVAAGDRSGWSVSGAGDLNDDGLDDLIIGAPSASRDGRGATGEVYIVFGRDDSEVAVDLSDFALQSTPDGVALRWSLHRDAVAETRGLQVQRRVGAATDWEVIAQDLPLGTAMQFTDALTAWRPMLQVGDLLQYRLLLTSHQGEVSTSATLSLLWSMARRTTLERPVWSEEGVRIQYSLARTETVQLQIFDVRGRLVHRFPTQTQAPGAYLQLWRQPLTSSAGRTAPGVYLVHLKAGPFAAAHKVVLARD